MDGWPVRCVVNVFQLEGQNSLLVRENAELQAQVLTLRQRLLSLPANAAKEIYRLSIQVCARFHRDTDPS